MTNDERDRRALGRRQFVRYGGGVVGAGLLAGCTGDGGDDSNRTPETTGGSETGEASEAESATDSGTATDGSYTVSMAPVGDVEFESVPENVMVYSLLYADMAVAYGHGDAVNSLGFSAQAGGNTLDAYYERLDGVSFDAEGLTQLNSGSGSIQVEKELFYELDSDLHLVDPALVDSFDGWDPADIEEVRTEIAPWFGNVYSRAHSQPPEGWRDQYEYYTLWELAEKVAAVFRESSRYEALASVHEQLVADVQSNLPPEGERPSVAAAIYMDGTFYPSKINAPGFATAHTRPLQAVDAFIDAEVSYETSYDFETMLEVDPDVILHPFGVASYYDVAAIRQRLEDHPVGGELTAVQNGRVYAAGNPVQGPLMNLFQVEMTAKQLYPEQFGEWPGYEQGSPYPEIPAEQQLFDRGDVAAAVTGDQ